MFKLTHENVERKIPEVPNDTHPRRPLGQNNTEKKQLTRSV